MYFEHLKRLKVNFFNLLKFSKLTVEKSNSKELKNLLLKFLNYLKKKLITIFYRRQCLHIVLFVLSFDFAESVDGCVCNDDENNEFIDMTCSNLTTQIIFNNQKKKRP